MTTIIIAGKKVSGIKETDKVRIGRNFLNQPRLEKSSDGIKWELVDHPENYGHPSIQIKIIQSNKQ